MSDRARAWLAVRAGAVPPELEVVMESAVDEVIGEDTALPHALAEAARICLHQVLRNCDHRSAALPLLAADALMTYACEAAVDEPGDALDDLARSCEPARLARMLTQR